jgi:hypothetical protein
MEYKYSSESGGPNGMYCWSPISGPMGSYPLSYGYYDNLAGLTADFPTGQAGDQFFVGDILYIWDEVSPGWVAVSPGDYRIGCTYGWSEEILSGNKGRVVMGTLGSDALGTRFSFDLGIVVSGTEIY